MVIVYISVNDKTNSEMRKEIEKILQENEKALVIVGYFKRRVFQWRARIRYQRKNYTRVDGEMYLNNVK